jgi:hypothetical protein
MSNCNERNRQDFDFTVGGSVVMDGLCLSPPGANAKAGDGVVLSPCTAWERQTWKRDADFIKHVQTGLCLSVTVERQPHPILDACTFDANRKWTLAATVPANWPASAGLPVAADKTPASSIVAGSALTNSQIASAVGWMQAETSISKTAFCWKKPGYDRGVGTLPDCGGKQMDAGLCYDNCRSGYAAVGPVCWQNCGAGWQDTGAFCSRTDARSYVPAWHCTNRAAGVCWTSAPDSCRSGYHGVAGVCWLDTPWDVAKGSYGRGAGTMPSTCNSSRDFQAGLCYAKPRSSYTCSATICTQQCAVGSTACGSGCAQNSGTCVASVVDMVVSPAIMMASLATDGAAGVAVAGVKLAARDAKRAAELGTAAAELALILKSSLEKYMAAAENDLAAISTPDVAKAVADKYTRGTPNYRQIAREYALLQLLAALSGMFQQLDLLAITTADISGISGTIAAYAKPPCEQHTRMP